MATKFIDTSRLNKNPAMEQLENELDKSIDKGKRGRPKKDNSIDDNNALFKVKISKTLIEDLDRSLPLITKDMGFSITRNIAVTLALKDFLKKYMK